MEYCIIDLEATGGNHRNTRVMDIGIYVLKGKDVIDQYSTLVNPEKSIDFYVKKLTGISDEMVAKAPTFAEIADTIQSYLRGRLFVAHNVSFDYNLLSAEFRRIGLKLAEDRLCTLELSRKLIDEIDTHSLGKVCEHLKIQISGRHRAAGDALATTELLNYLITEKGATDIIPSFIISKNHNDLNVGKSHLDPERVDMLPDMAGLFYLKNELDDIVYIGKGASIREKVVSTLKGKGSARKLARNLGSVHDISIELTGNELIAELRYYQEIFRQKPRYNENIKQLIYKYYVGYAIVGAFRYVGIFRTNDLSGVALAYHKDYKTAEKHLCKVASKYKLKRSQLHFDIKTRKTIPQEVNTEELIAGLNVRVAEMVEKQLGKPSSYFVLGSGREAGESSVVQIENGDFVGWGFYQKNGKEINLAKQVNKEEVMDGLHITKRMIIETKDLSVLDGGSEQIV